MFPYVERRKATADRRGTVTVEVDGFTVIRPSKEAARFDEHPADVSAFILDEAFRKPDDAQPPSN